MSYKILFKIASRSRPDRLIESIKSIMQNVADKQNYSILISLDSDDPTNTEEFRKRLRNLAFPGYIKSSLSKNKIDAINRDIDLIAGWDILIVSSDDMFFQMPGFDNWIREQFDTLDLLLHVPDGNRSDLLTLPIMGRAYYHRDSYVYHPSYESLWCDNEQMEVAKIRGKYKMTPMPIARHTHPAYGGGKWDPLYEKNERPEIFEKDKMNYETRKAQQFA